MELARMIRPRMSWSGLAQLARCEIVHATPFDEAKPGPGPNLRLARGLVLGIRMRATCAMRVG